MKRRTQKITYNIVVGVLIACGIAWVSAKFIHLGKVEYTDNAQVKQLIVPVNSRVQGFIQKIYFDEYQKVRKGDTLAIIEDAEFRLRLAQAEADYQNALSGKTVMTSTIHTTQNNISVSDAASKRLKFAWITQNGNTNDTRICWSKTPSPNSNMTQSIQITRHPRPVMSYCSARNNPPLS